MPRKSNANTIKNLFPYVVLILVIFVVLSVLNMGRVTTHELTTGELMNAIASKTITEITITPSQEKNIYYIEGKINNYKENETFQSKVVEAELSNIIKYAESNNLNVYETNPDPGSFSWMYIIVNVVPLLLLVVFTYFLFSKMANSNKGSMDFGKSRAKLSEDGGSVTFKRSEEHTSELQSH